MIRLLEPTGGSIKVRGEEGAFGLLDSWAQLDERGIPSPSGFDSNFFGYDKNDDGDYVDPGEMSPWAIVMGRQ